MMKGRTMKHFGIQFWKKFKSENTKWPLCEYEVEDQEHFHFSVKAAQPSEPNIVGFFFLWQLYKENTDDIVPHLLVMEQLSKEEVIIRKILIKELWMNRKQLIKQAQVVNF